MQRSHVALLSIAVATALALIPAAGAAGGAPTSYRYVGKTDAGKIRLAVRGGRVANIVVSADATCRDESGDVVEPYWGSGVTSGFNRTKLDESGAFRSHQRYRHRNPVTHKVEPLYRDLRGSVEGPTGRAKVSIRYTIPLHRFRGQQVKCRTGRIAFDLSRLPRE